MISQKGVENMWVRGGVGARYAKHERARPYAMTRDAQRFLVWLWLGVERLVEPSESDTLFKWALEQFADAGINCLSPKPPSELKAPDAWRDPWGNPLPNPFATKDLKGQTLLTQRDPILAEWFKKFAESPYAAASEWADKQAQVLKKKALVYDADTHAVNPYVNGANETELGRFVRNADQATVERCKWEAKEVTFPTGKNSNLTIQGQIAKNPRLNALWNSMQEAERTHIASAKAALQQQRIEAEARLKELQAADAAPQPERLAQRVRLGAE